MFARGVGTELRLDYGPEDSRALVRRSKDANQSRRLLALAAVLDGHTRVEAAKIGSMDRQTLRNWVHRFNGSSPEELIDRKAPGQAPKLSASRGRLTKPRSERPSKSSRGRIGATMANLHPFVMVIHINTEPGNPSNESLSIVNRPGFAGGSNS